MLGSPWWLATVVAVAVALRVAHVLALRGTPWFDYLVVDPEFYDAWARRIAAGDWLGDRAFYADPLYPYLLGALYRVAGRDLLVVRLLNVAFSAAACLLVARIGRRLGGPVVGGVAALGLALYEPDVFFTGEVDKTSLSMMLAAATLALGLTPSLAARFGTGVALSATALTRANFLLFIPLAAAAFLLDRGDGGGGLTARRRAAAGCALFLAGVALVLAPVAWRNHHVSGSWVLTTAQAGQNFYTGNNPTNPYGAYGAVPFVRSNLHFEELDFRAEAERRTGRSMTPSEASSFWLREAFAHMRNDPAFAIRAFARKAVLFWNDFEIADSQDQYLFERYSPVLRWPLLGFGMVAPLALLGAVVGFRTSRAVRLLCGFVVVYWASLVAFFLFARYRIQIVPALLPLAGIGVVALGARLREPRRLVPAVAIVGAAMVVCFLRMGLFWRDHPITIEMRLRHLASVQATIGDVDGAIATLKQGIAPCPSGCPHALADLADVYLRAGRTADGERWFREFVRQHPEQRDAPEHLARLRGARPAGMP